MAAARNFPSLDLPDRLKGPLVQARKTVWRAWRAVVPRKIPAPNDYAVLLHCMINQWRAAQGATPPFIITQLPQFIGTPGWVEIRAMAQVARGEADSVLGMFGLR